MKPVCRSILAALGLLVVAPTAAYPADRPTAGDFPGKPIRVIIPFPPGGSNDLLMRFLGIKLAERLGQQIVVDNRGGANGIIGATLAAHAPPDGYTLLMVSTSYIMNAAVRSLLPYDVEKSFAPVAMIGTSPNCIVVNPGFGVDSVRELVERARAKPASIFYASTGVGGFNHFGGELFKKLAGINLVMVPYKGGGAAMVDVIGGQIPMMFSSVTQVLPHVRSGKLKVIAVGAAKRTPALPDTPTVAEAGYPGYEVYVWWGIVAPTGIASAIVNRLHKEITAILTEPATHDRLANDAAETIIVSPAEFDTFMHEDLQKWTAVAKEAGIHLQ